VSMKKNVAIIILILLAAASSAIAESDARVVKYNSRTIVPIKAKLRYTTLIELPANEKILEAATGDRDYWIIDAVQNFCFLHPAKNGIRSNLNLITDHGNVYSFTLEEVAADPDLKVIVEPTDTSTIAKAARFVDASDVEAYRQQAQLARVQASDAVNRFESEYPTKQEKFDYRYKDEAPFNIAAIYHDEHFTYIKSNATEKFTLYELKDGQPNLTNFDLRDGTYVIPKVIDKGYVQIGKKRLSFERKQQ
jgi:type IV secretion system protein VirB9